MSILFRPGNVVFSDIDFPFYSKNYIDEILGLWNQRWNTTSMLNIPRLLMIYPLYIISKLADYNGRLLLKMFILVLMYMSSFSMYLFSKRLVSVYMGSRFDLGKILSVIYGSLLYALNPYLLFRIQHIYLLVGYSLFPLILLLFFKIFDHKFLEQTIDGFSPYDRKVDSKTFLNIVFLSIVITVSSAAIHYFFYSVIFLGIIYLLLIFKYYFEFRKIGKGNAIKVISVMIKKLFVMITVFIGYSFYFLSTYIGGILFGVQASQNNVNVLDTYLLFSKNSSVFNVTYLISYWWPMFDLNQFPISFYIGGGVIIAIITFAILFNSRKNHIVLFFSIILIGSIIVSTGVKYTIIAPFFIKLVELPIIGSIFRDPNKIVGILVLAYSVLLIFGIEKILYLIRKFKYRKITTVALFMFISMALFLYLIPMRSLYIERYLEPVLEPDEYRELREEYSDTNALAIYLPNADHMTRPYSGVSTPYWNKANNDDDTKATGDIQIYNSVIDTVFHHEGNFYGISYLLSYLQTLMDEGLSNNFDNYIKVFGANKLIYVDQYLEQEDRQDFNKEIIESTSNLDVEYENNIFKVYNSGLDFDNRYSEASLKNKIYTPYGLYKFESYNNLAGYNVLSNPAIFTNMKESSVYDTMEIGDILDIKDSNDFLLTQYPKDYYLYPFNYINEGNAFLKWSKTFVKNSDWQWFLKSQQINTRSYDFDFDRGVALTFVSKKLDLLPHIKDKVKGSLILDFETILRNDDFFIPDNPDIFDVKPNPYSMQNDIPSINGVILKGDPENIWQVAKSSLLRAKEETPYRYSIVISGRGANKIHLKARFYNEFEEEIGVQYIVAPSEVVDFDTINFTGEVISPKGAKNMRIDLLSFENPKNKVFWWIHDINIYDLSAYKSENIIKASYNAKEEGLYKPYVRLFYSPKGGLVEINVNDKKYEINTKSKIVSAFKWVQLDSVNLNYSNDVIISNQDGFNAINVILFEPEKNLEKLKNPIMKAIEKTSQLITFESEVDFDFNGNLQSRRNYPLLSYGRGISIDEGSLSTEFEIIKDDSFIIDPKIYFKDKSLGFVDFTIKDNIGRTVFEKRFEKRKKSNMYSKSIDFTPLNSTYTYMLIDSNYESYINLETESVDLSAGKYTLYFNVNSEVDNLISFESLSKKLIDDTKDDFIQNEVNFNCSECEKISADMFRAIKSVDEMTIEYDKTCSCDWYIYSSPWFDVKEYEEYLIEFLAKSENIVKRHGKLIFIDEFDHIVDTVYINEVEERYKSRLNKYEQIVEVPSGVKKASLQFLARGSKVEIGSLYLADLKLKKYEKFITIDSLMLRSEKIDLIDTNKNKKNMSILLKEKSDMKRSFQIVDEHDGNVDIQRTNNTNEKFSKKDSQYINSFLTPHKIWKNNGKSYDLILNVVSASYKHDKSVQILNLDMTLRKSYIFGLFLSAFTGVLSIIIYLYKKDK